MTDIFDNAILCNNCGKQMQTILISKNGFNLRAKKCAKCGAAIVHPQDKAEYENFMRLKQKEFNVKMRMVGNSYAVSIPREIVDFMRDQESMINDMVKLSFEDAGRLRLMFNTNEDGEQNSNSRVIKSREVHVVKNNKPVLHAREFSDSAHPERNKKQVIRAEKINEDEAEEDFEEGEEE
jgi:hypothetical protein